jgi:hypothetical protein
MAGCGGDDSGGGSDEETAAAQIRPAPEGYRYVDAPNQEAQAEFEQQVREDLGADDVAVRSVYRNDKLTAGLVVAHVADPPPAEEIAATVLPGRRTDLTEVEVGDGSAQLVAARGRARETAVIDTFGEYVLIVSAWSGPDALEVAAPNVR